MKYFFIIVSVGISFIRIPAMQPPYVKDLITTTITSQGLHIKKLTTLEQQKTISVFYQLGLSHHQDKWLDILLSGSSIVGYLINPDCTAVRLEFTPEQGQYFIAQIERKLATP